MADATTHPLLQKITSYDELRDVMHTNRNAIDPETYAWFSNRDALPLHEKVRKFRNAFCNETLNNENFWKIREYLRVRTNAYKRIHIWQRTDNLLDFLPTERYRNLYPHKSAGSDPLIAYTPDNDKGMRDLQVKTKIGKFLNKYLSDRMSEAEIRQVSTEFNSGQIPYTLHIAKTAQEIEMVYRNCATQSCMSKNPDFWSVLHESNVHPTHVYESPDISCAYVKDPEGRIVARTLINHVHNSYVRIYGHDEAMKYLLRITMNITSCRDLRDARIKRIDLPENRIVLPYLDGDSKYVEFLPDGEYLRVQREMKDAFFRQPNWELAYVNVTQMCINCNTRRATDGYQLENQPNGWCRTCLDDHTRNIGFIERRAGGDATFMISATATFVADPNNTEGYAEVWHNQYRMWIPTTDRLLNEATVSALDNPEYRVLRHPNNEVLAFDNQTKTLIPKYIHNYTNSKTTIQYGNGTKAVYSPHMEAALTSGAVVHAPVFNVYVAKEYAVKAIYKLNGAQTTAPKCQCIYIVEADIWITRNLWDNYRQEFTNSFCSIQRVDQDVVDRKNSTEIMQHYRHSSRPSENWVNVIPELKQYPWNTNEVSTESETEYEEIEA